ncbi:MAG: hypothetical protein IPI77_19895 [Saprospiraceae bacterium]|nr:hypothetical protein [Saprospiraceae bacterium]
MAERIPQGEGLKRVVDRLLLAALVGNVWMDYGGSGLVERPWVNTYKLSIHLGLALITLSFYGGYFEISICRQSLSDKIGTVLARTFLFWCRSDFVGRHDEWYEGGAAISQFSDDGKSFDRPYNFLKLTPGGGCTLWIMMYILFTGFGTGIAS